LSASSEEPFYVVITARILTSPDPQRTVTLWTHLSPLKSLHTTAFNNIVCTDDSAKRIEIWPRSYPQYRFDGDDLPDHGDFITIPPKGQPGISIRHKVPREAIRNANLKVGERYRVNLTDKCLGTRWWFFDAREDFPGGARLCSWKSKATQDAEAEEENDLDGDIQDELEDERREKYGNRPVKMSEEPGLLALVPEGGEVEFEVV
jgi:hypothetical protein